MKNIASRKIAVYSRKSKFTGKGESIENQIELCKQYIRIHQPDISEDDILVYEDEGYSGGHIDRPRFKQLINDIRSNKIEKIVCYRLDRISRNIGDFAKLIEELNLQEIKFISIRENFDTDSPIGRAMMYIASVFSQLERETIAERIRDNMLELAKTGRWLGGITPTGYVSESVENVTVDGKLHKAYKLTVLPEEARLIHLVFSKFLEENSLTKIETYLLQNHIKTKNGKAFTRFTIRGILENPVYMIADESAYEYFKRSDAEIFGGKELFDRKHGIMAYNKTIQKKGKTNQQRDMSEWIIAVGRHDGLITGEKWVKTQQQLVQNKSKSYRKPKSSVALLSGFLFCSCGAYMRPKQGRSQNKDGEWVFSYLCETKEKSRCKLCCAKNPNGNTLDKMISEEIKKLSHDRPIFAAELEKARDYALLQTNEDDSELDRLKGLLAETDKKISALVSALARLPESAHEYIATQISKLHTESISLNERVKMLERIAPNRALSGEEIEVFRDKLSSVEGIFDSMCVEQKRAALTELIQRITWDGENVRLYFRGAIMLG